MCPAIVVCLNLIGSCYVKTLYCCFDTVEVNSLAVLTENSRDETVCESSRGLGKS